MKNKEIKRVSLFFISSGVCSLISMIVNMVLTRMMDKKTYGILGMLYSASAVLIGIICLGSDNSYTRFFFERPNNDDIKDYSSKSIKLIILPLVIVTFIFLIACPLFSVFLFESKNSILIICLLMYSVSMVFYRFQNIYFRMMGDGLHFAFQCFAVLVFPRIIMLVLYVVLHNYSAIIFMTIVSFLVSLLFILQYRNIFFSFWKKSFSGYKSYISYALMTAPLIGLDNLNAWIPQYLIKNYSGLEILGIYNAALIFPAGLNVLKSCFITIWAPFVYKNYKKEEGFFDKYNKLMTCIVVVFMGGFLLLSDYIYLLVGEDFRVECRILGLIIFIPLCLLLFETTSYGISVSNKVYIQTIMIAITSVFIFLGGKYVGRKYGLIGILVIIASTYLLYYLISSVISNKYLKMVKSMNRVFLSGIITFLLAILFILFYDKRIWFNIIDCTIMIVFLYKYRLDIFALFSELKKSNSSE